MGGFLCSQWTKYQTGFSFWSVEAVSQGDSLVYVDDQRCPSKFGSFYFFNYTSESVSISDTSSTPTVDLFSTLFLRTFPVKLSFIAL